MKYFLPLLIGCFCILIAVTSCSKSNVTSKNLTDITGTKTGTGTTSGTTDVYVAGAESPTPTTSEEACYWKNGTKVSLLSGPEPSGRSDRRHQVCTGKFYFCG
jgi:hypothetical protein